MDKVPPDFESVEAAADLPDWGRPGCPPAQMLRAARMDALPEELQAGVSAHLLTCRSCRTLQADIADLPEPSDATPGEVRRILDRVRREERAMHRRGMAFFLKAALAPVGLALLTALLVWQLRNSGLHPGPDQPPHTAQKTSAKPQSPDVFTLQKPAVKMSLAVLTWRGTGNDAGQYLRDMAPAMDSYRADRYAEAASGFETLSSRYKSSVEVFFYLGVSRLILGELPAACIALERAARLTDDSLSADVSWYLALAYQRSGRTVEAQKVLAGLCGAPNEYRDRACAAIKELAVPAGVQPPAPPAPGSRNQ